MKNLQFELNLIGGEITTKLIDGDYNFPDYYVIKFTIEHNIKAKSIQGLFQKLDNFFSQPWSDNQNEPIEVYVSFYNPDETPDNCRRGRNSKLFQKSDAKKTIDYQIVISGNEQDSIKNKIKDYIKNSLTDNSISNIDKDAIIKLVDSLKSNIEKLKHYKENVPKSDDYDSDKPKKICDEIIESLKVFAFSDNIPSEVLEIFKSEKWLMSHQFEYWRYNSFSDTNSLSSCNLFQLLESNNKVHKAINSVIKN